MSKSSANSQNQKQPDNAATEKQIVVKIDSDRVEKLKGNGYSLCFAKKVGDHDYNVIWSSATDFMVHNVLSWIPKYEIFCTHVFQDGDKVQSSTAYKKISLGETIILDKYGVLGTAKTGGPKTSMTLKNNFEDIHVGIQQSVKPVNRDHHHVKPMYVSKDTEVTGDVKLTPKEIILVWFEQEAVTSSMFSEAKSKSKEVILTDSNSATITYDKDGNWEVG